MQLITINYILTSNKNNLWSTFCTEQNMCHKWYLFINWKIFIRKNILIALKLTHHPEGVASHDIHTPHHLHILAIVRHLEYQLLIVLLRQVLNHCQSVRKINNFILVLSLMEVNKNKVFERQWMHLFISKKIISICGEL